MLIVEKEEEKEKHKSEEIKMNIYISSVKKINENH